MLLSIRNAVKIFGGLRALIIKNLVHFIREALQRGFQGDNHLYFIFILIPVQTLFAHNWLTLPYYLDRAFRGAAGGARVSASGTVWRNSVFKSHTRSESGRSPVIRLARAGAQIGQGV